MGGVTCYVPPTRVALSMRRLDSDRNPPRGELGRGARRRKPARGDEEEIAPAAGGNGAGGKGVTKSEPVAYNEVTNGPSETDTDTEEFDGQDSPNSSEPTQCERNPLCIRGYKHGGKPGRCKLRAGQYEECEYTKGRSDNQDTCAETMQSLSESAVKGLEWLSQAPNRHSPQPETRTRPERELALSSSADPPEARPDSWTPTIRPHPQDPELDPSLPPPKPHQPGGGGGARLSNPRGLGHWGVGGEPEDGADIRAGRHGQRGHALRRP